MSDELHKLGSKVAAEQDAALEDGRALRAARERFVLSLSAVPRERGSLMPKLAAAFAVALVAVGLIWMRRSEPPQMLTYSVDAGAVEAHETRFIDAASTPRALRFSDGTRLELAPHSAMRVLSVDQQGARIALEQGALDVEVVHRDASTRWIFEVGPYHVQVVGTRFQLDWQRATGHFVIHMQEGKVRVAGPDVVRELGAGESYASAGAQVPLTLAASAAAQGDAGQAQAESGAPVEEEPAAMLRQAKRVQENDPSEATRLYRAIRKKHGGTRVAADAAFMLARLEGESARAIVLLETYLREQPKGPYVDAALGRLVRTQHKLGDDAGAQKHARRYLSLYPQGPYAAEAKQVLAVP